MELHTDRARRGRAKNVLGKMYQSGDGVTRNFQEAATVTGKSKVPRGSAANVSVPSDTIR